MMTPQEAIRRLERDGVLPLRSVIHTVAGTHVRGSWWAHPKGRVIFRVSRALEDSPDALVTKLIDGKVTFVHRALWPALLRVVTDPGWRRRALTSLDPLARRLLSKVERSRGPVRLDELGERWQLTNKTERHALARARRSLERNLLCRAAERHTESGRHAAILESWRHWAPKKLLTKAGTLGLHDAAARLRQFGGGPTVLDTHLPFRI